MTRGEPKQLAHVKLPDGGFSQVVNSYLTPPGMNREWLLESDVLLRLDKKPGLLVVMVNAVGPQGQIITGALDDIPRLDLAQDLARVIMDTLNDKLNVDREGRDSRVVKS